VRLKKPKVPITEPAELAGLFLTEADVWKALVGYFTYPRPARKPKEQIAAHQ
jgi:hypothetical protein